MDLIPIGIANSVFKTTDYDWIKTIEFANQLKISILQLHIGQFDPEYNWSIKICNFSEVYLHLFTDTNCSQLPLETINRNLKTPILIQHERYIQLKDIEFFKNNQLSLGYENDQDKLLGDYFSSLNDLHRHKLNITAIIDFPRFFHQFLAKHSEQDVYNQIINILIWCRDNHIPVILHAIDINDYDPHVSKWVPLFSGILPWNKFLKFVLNESIPIKSIIFEYEDTINTEKSVYSLREWFKNYQ